jgi:hypothetical protein
MQYEAFTDVFTTEFKSFTSRMWLDYCDETKGPFAKTKDYAGYVRNNLKWLVKEYNKRNGKKELNIK